MYPLPVRGLKPGNSFSELMEMSSGLFRQNTGFTQEAAFIGAWHSLVCGHITSISPLSSFCLLFQLSTHSFHIRPQLTACLETQWCTLLLKALTLTAFTNITFQNKVKLRFCLISWDIYLAYSGVKKITISEVFFINGFQRADCAL